jgi:hypothetical protein
MRKMVLNAWMAGFMLMATVAGSARGDELEFADGQTVKGSFVGFRDHRFLFKTADGRDVSEFAAKIQGIVIDKPRFVSAQFVTKKFDRVQFKGYRGFMVRMTNEDGALEEPVTLLKRMELVEGAETSETPAAVGIQEPSPPRQAPTAMPTRVAPRSEPTTGATPAGGRDWKRSGTWREVDGPGAVTISHGEEVDIDKALQKGVVNVVHFHLGTIHSSIRQGNYVETLAAKSKGRVVVRRIKLPGWEAQICAAKGLNSLPQFWFYSRSGQLVRKLTERFTEADLETALKESLRAQ